MDYDALVKRLKEKRIREGLSIRKLADQIGVSFSSLARIERRDGDPDNNSTIRILEWLGELDDPNQIGSKDVALVHFRAAKDIRDRCVECLLLVALDLKSAFGHNSQLRRIHTDLSEGHHPPLSKPEMEAMAQQLRSSLHYKDADPFPALSLTIEGVESLDLQAYTGEHQNCRMFLSGPGCSDWSAMSVPLDADGDRWVILRNDLHNIERQKVTYLEECWHILLGHKLTKVAKVGKAFGRTFSNSEEHDAFYLASATLLPEKGVRQMVKSGSTAEDIAHHYGVSAHLAEYRIKRLGLWLEHKKRGVSLRASDRT